MNYSRRPIGILIDALSRNVNVNICRQRRINSRCDDEQEAGCAVLVEALWRFGASCLLARKNGDEANVSAEEFEMLEVRVKARVCRCERTTGCKQDTSERQQCSQQRAIQSGPA